MNPETNSLPPHSIEAEQGLLGCLMLDADHCLPRFVAEYQGGRGSFYDFRHIVVFEAIQEVFDRGLHVNGVSVPSWLRKLGKIDDAGGDAYVAALPDCAPSESNFSFHAGTVREHVVRRAALAASATLANAARDTTTDVGAVIAAAETSLQAIVTTAHGAGEASMADILRDVLSDWQNAANGQNSAVIATGIGQLDNRIRGGFRPGQLVVIAARPGDGKTSLGMQIAANVAIEGRLPVGVFSLEMTQKELVGRLICSMAGIPAEIAERPISNGQEAAARSGALGVASAKLNKAPLYIIDKAPLTITQLRAHARSMSMRHKLRLIVVDYLGLLDGSNPKASAYEKTTEASKALKGLAKELNLPVVLLCQLNRENVKEKREPQLYDLRDSGSIEQDADLVLMPYTTAAESVDLAPITIFIRKQRGGRRGSFDMVFNRPLTRFEADIDH
jgi:replicative DNA helicase